MNILNVGYKSTNYWLVGPEAARLLVDVGWPGTLQKFLHELKRVDVPLKNIKYMLATHYHPDHAGLVGELLDSGVKLVILDTQLAGIRLLEQIVKPRDHFHTINPAGAIQLTSATSRAWLKGAGIAGEILSTPGHSDDSVTLILDSGEAFTGDLTVPGFAAEDKLTQVEASWAKIRGHGAKLVYPAHSPMRPLAP